MLEAGHDKTTTSYPLWTLDKETVTRLASEAAGPDGDGIVAPTGKPGSVLMFHGNLVHASPPNITPYPRKIVYLTLCAVSNHITKFTRPEFIAHRDFTPIVPVARRRAGGIRPRASRRRGINFRIAYSATASFGGAIKLSTMRHARVVATALQLPNFCRLTAACRDARQTV